MSKDWQELKEQASALVKSQFLPKSIDTAEKALAIMMAGNELNIPPMQSIRHLFVQDGKVQTSAELMLALILRSGQAEMMHLDVKDEECLIQTRRRGQPLHEIRFTIQDAQKAGLLVKDTWKKYPRALLRSRCISEMSRTVYPDVCLGLYTFEEMDTPVVVSSEGEVMIDPPLEVEMASIPSPSPDNPLEENIPPPDVPPPKLPEERTKNFQFLDAMEQMKKGLGGDAYYRILGSFGFEKSDEVLERSKQIAVYKAMQAALQAQTHGALWETHDDTEGERYNAIIEV